MQNTLVVKRPEWMTDDELKRISAELVEDETGQYLRFDECTKEQVEAAIYELPAIEKRKDVKIGGEKAISGDELRVLQEITNLNLNKGKVYRFAAANTRIDRTNERFTVEVLQKFANDINSEGRSFLFSHDRAQIIGKVFSAQVVQDEKGNAELVEYAFILDGTKMPGQEIEVADAIESGLLDFVSVGFSAYRRKIDDGGRVYVEYFMDFDNNDHKEFTEQTELSIVYLGAQRGARAKEYRVESLKFVELNNNEMTDELKAKVAEHEATIEGLNSEIESLKSEKAENEKSVESLTAENEKLNGMIEKYLEPFRNDVLNLQSKFLSEPARLSEDQVKSLQPEQVIAMANDLRSKFKDEADKNKIEGKDKKTEKLGF